MIINGLTKDDLLEWEYLAKKYDETNIPLYLSYPTTSFWKGAADGESYADAFGGIEAPFLYFHFPFCKKACYYCCCYKTVATDEQDKERYLCHLEKEMELKLKALHIERLKNVRHMHWGGGTPTYLTCGQIEKAFSIITKHAEIAGSADTGISDTSLSIEAFPDPEMLKPEKLRLLRSLGFNEISFGIQDFDARIQKAINRDCKPETVKEIIGQAKALGFRIHIDLCYGLPFQGLNELERTISHVVEMAPDRIAAFPYAHYPMIFPLQKKIPASSLPNSYIKILLIRQAAGLLTAAGYGKIGIDHFVKKDNQLYAAARKRSVIKDFMGYSVGERRSFLGFGASAISFSGAAYFHNTCSLEGYYSLLKQDKLPLEKSMVHIMSAEDKIRSAVIQQGVLCDFVIDKERVEKQFGIEFDRYFHGEIKALAPYAGDGLITSASGRTITVTPEGEYVARHIAHVFDKYYTN